MQYIKRRPELLVYLDERKRIVKVALNDFTRDALANEARMLLILSGTLIAPELVSCHGDTLIEEYIPGPSFQDFIDNKSIPQTSQEVLLVSAGRLVSTLDEYQIRHGDLRSPNLIITPHNKIVAIDWQQSNLIGELEFDKNKGVTDVEMLTEALAGIGIEYGS